MPYFPDPTRIWERVHGRCLNLQGEHVKAGVLKYRNMQGGGGGGGMTATQRYARVAKGQSLGGRRQVYATQSQTYSEPNQLGWYRKNAQVVVVVGDVCPFIDGGSLVCGIVANNCTNIPKKPLQPPTSSVMCFPGSFSGIRGDIRPLCSSSSSSSSYPSPPKAPSYRMASSGGGKFPQGYKGLKSACIR